MDVQVCHCGNVFKYDADFCRKCGDNRPPPVDREVPLSREARLEEIRLREARLLEHEENLTAHARDLEYAEQTLLQQRELELARRKEEEEECRRNQGLTERERRMQEQELKMAERERALAFKEADLCRRSQDPSGASTTLAVREVRFPTTARPDVPQTPGGSLRYIATYGGGLRSPDRIQSWKP